VTRTLAFAHRWLGIAGGALFVLWFLSGLVMLYVRMPALDPAERLARMSPLELEAVRVHPSDAAHAAGLRPDRVRIGMLGDRPVYRFAESGSWSAVLADDGQVVLGLRDHQALQVASGFAPSCAATMRHDRFLSAPDQWTLQLRALLPLHRIACGDRERTMLYVSDRTAEVVLRTTGGHRFWAYLGPVTHWIYFTPLRRQSELWLDLLVAASFAGCLLALSGLVLGISRFSFRGQRHRHGRGHRPGSPYTGSLRWHHYAGLVFGLVTFGWVLSGGLSLDPLDWHTSTSPGRSQREAVAGGPLRLEALEPDRLRAAVGHLASSFHPRELEAVQFQGQPFLLAYRPPPPGEPRARRIDREPSEFLSTVLPLEHALVSVLEPPRDPPRFDEPTLLAAVALAMPEARTEEATLLTSYDSYYYDRSGELPLPVLRVRFDDARRTWLYVDPGRGLLLRREDRSSRLDRWLYRALHRWDFPGLYARRPLWDVVVILLLLGGLALGTTSVAPALRRLRGHAMRGRGLMLRGTPEGQEQDPAS
jgi:hypothetical protein